MNGKQAIITVGERIISLIRKKCILKYGSYTCIQKQARGITEWQDVERCFEAKVNHDRYLDYTKTKKLSLDQNIKIINEIQAAGDMGLNLLTFQILSAVVPLGMNVEFKIFKPSNPYLGHMFCSIRPINTDDKEETLAIDPRPSNQIIKPQVVTLKDHFLADQNIETGPGFSNISADLEFRRFQSLEDFSMNDFNLRELDRIEKLIDSKEVSSDQSWAKFRDRNPGISIYDLIKLDRHRRDFTESRRELKSVKKFSDLIQ